MLGMAVVMRVPYTRASQSKMRRGGSTSVVATSPSTWLFCFSAPATRSERQPSFRLCEGSRKCTATLRSQPARLAMTKISVSWQQISYRQKSQAVHLGLDVWAMLAKMKHRTMRMTTCYLTALRSTLATRIRHEHRKFCSNRL